MHFSELYSVAANMFSRTLYLLSLIALSVAQNQTVSLVLPGADSQSLVGSVVGGVRNLNRASQDAL